MASNISIRLGKRIRALRLKRGWRQIDLAAHSDLGKTHIHHIETAKSEICLDSLNRIAQALGL